MLCKNYGTANFNEIIATSSNRLIQIKKVDDEIKKNGVQCYCTNKKKKISYNTKFDILRRIVSIGIF